MTNYEWECGKNFNIDGLEVSESILFNRVVAVESEILLNDWMWVFFS